MTSTTFFFLFIPILALILLLVNILLAPHNSYQEKNSVFECGFHSFLGQNRTQFSISFFIFGLLFLLFDLEILLVYPYSVSGYTNDIYGLAVMMIFFVLLTLGFIFELGKNALTIDSRQTKTSEGDYTNGHSLINSVRVSSAFGQFWVSGTLLTYIWDSSFKFYNSSYILVILLVIVSGIVSGIVIVCSTNSNSKNTMNNNTAEQDNKTRCTHPIINITQTNVLFFHQTRLKCPRGNLVMPEHDSRAHICRCLSIGCSHFPGCGCHR